MISLNFSKGSVRHLFIYHNYKVHLCKINHIICVFKLKKMYLVDNNFNSIMHIIINFQLMIFDQVKRVFVVIRKNNILKENMFSNNKNFSNFSTNLMFRIYRLIRFFEFFESYIFSIFSSNMILLIFRLIRFFRLF